MRKLISILILLPFIGLSQKKDILKYKNNTFKGTLIEYSVKDVRNNNSGYLTFYVNSINDTIRIKSDSNFSLEINKEKSYSFYEFDKKSWNTVEFGLSFDYFDVPYAQLFISKGLISDKFYNPGIGTGIFSIDYINFLPIYLTNSYDILPLKNPNRKNSLFRLFAFQNIGYSFAYDFGTTDYNYVDGGLLFNLGLGVKKSTKNKHLALKFAYQLQKYKSEHNFWFWDFSGDLGMIFQDQDITDNIIRRDGSFRRFSVTFSVTF
tara:strand:- start:593 stop:1381 length:789 start_codon:yes stop_codon:yes gene_type:complete